MFWKDNAPAPKKKPAEPKTEAKILHFSRPTPHLEKPASPETEEGASEDDVRLLSSEVVLLQREISRESQAGSQKSSAKSGYGKASEMYVVKSTTVEGKEKIRFASTNGVLINKKQA